MITANNILDIINITRKELQDQEETIEHLQKTTTFPLTNLDENYLRRVFGSIISPYNRNVSLAIIDEETQLLIDMLSNSASTITCSEDRDNIWKAELHASKVYIYLLDFCLRISNDAINRDYSWLTGLYRNLQCRSRIVVHTPYQYIAIISRSLDAIGTFQVPIEITVKHIPISGCIHMCETTKSGRETFVFGTVCTMLPKSKHMYQIDTTQSGYRPYIAIELGSGAITGAVKSQIGFNTPTLIDKLASIFRRNVVYPVDLDGPSGRPAETRPF
jgi:hypothetical protein